MLSVSQKGFRFQLPISDNEIWGIGMVACQWASLEDLLDHFIANVNNGPALAASGGPMSFKNRIKLLREIITVKVFDVPTQVSLLEIVDRIHSMQDDRDKVIHHIWSDNQDGKKTLFDWRQKSKQSECKIDLVKLRTLALKIESAKIDLLDFLRRAGNVNPGQPLFETAWLFISQKQDASQHR